MRNLVRSSLCLGLLVALAACGDSGTGPDEDELTEAEYEALLDVLVQLSGVGLDVALAGPAAVPEPFDVEETTVPCPQGGVIRVEGDGEIDDAAETLFLDLTIVHEACRASSSSGNRQFTIDGDPALEYAFFIGFNEDSFDMIIDEVGAFEWSTSGRSGTCEIDLHVEFTGTFSSEALEGFVSGTVCGRDASGTISG